MHVIRKTLSEGYDVTPLLDESIPSEKMKIYLNTKRQDIDTSYVLSKNITTKEAETIIELRKKGYKIENTI